MIELHLMRARGLDPSATRSLLCSSWFKAWCKTIQGRGADTFKGHPANTSHILQTCPMMTDLCIHRHIRVLDVVKRHLQSDPAAMVMTEPRVRSGDTNVQPDLCVKKIDGSAVLDAHVPYELSMSQLSACGRSKAAKYVRHTSAFRDYLNSTSIEFDGIVIGARGAITGSMSRRLMVMGLSKSEIRLMQLRATKGVGSSGPPS